jgi:hypothetical protein
MEPSFSASSLDPCLDKGYFDHPPSQRDIFIGSNFCKGGEQILKETLEVPQLEGDLESETRQNLLGTLAEASE